MKNAIATVLALALFIPGAASATITFYNQSGEPVWIAHSIQRRGVGFPCNFASHCSNTGNWKQQGWWSIYPGNNAVVTTQSWAAMSNYAWLAEGTLHVWYGSTAIRTCVPDAAHDRCHNLSDTSCPSGERLLKYRTQLAGDSCLASGSKSFTLTL